MIILITGKPGIGKSTIIQKLISLYDQPLRWVITKEIRNSDGLRVGFESVNSNGESMIISHKKDIKSDMVIGQNKVDVAAVEHMFTKDILASSAGELMLLDEIGPIQMLSHHFARSLKVLFKKPAERVLVASIHQSDKKLARYRKARSALLITVSEENRDSLPSLLLCIINAHEKIDALRQGQLARFRPLFTEYANKGQSIQLSKLLSNALPYVLHGKVRKAGGHTYMVAGNHGEHQVARHGRAYACDCDLFNGSGIYKGKAGVCSHIQAVKIRY